MQVFKTIAYNRLNSVAVPVITTLNKTAATFIIAMGPKYAPNLAIFWGLAYLTITVCLWALGIDNDMFNASSVHKMSIDSRRKWQSFEQTLDELRSSLIMLNLIIQRVDISESGRSEDREMVATSIYPVFTSLLDFWIESVRWFDSAGEYLARVYWFRPTNVLRPIC